MNYCRILFIYCLQDRTPCGLTSLSKTMTLAFQDQSCPQRFQVKSLKAYLWLHVNIDKRCKKPTTTIIVGASITWLDISIREMFVHWIQPCILMVSSKCKCYSCMIPLTKGQSIISEKL